MFFCCLGYKRNKESIGDVAGLLAEFFADLNVPSSHLAAGFVLLSKYQEAQQKWIAEHRYNSIENFLTGVPISSDTKYIDLSTAEDTHLINDLIYYMNYSLAIFGWPLQAFETPCNICCICPYLKLSSCFSKRHKLAKQKRAATFQEPQADKKSQKTATTTTKKKKKKGPDSEAVTLKKDDATSGKPDESVVNEQVCNENLAPRCVPGQLNDDCEFPIILDDNCCSCNLASAEHRLASHNYEIIYINYRVDVHVVPFLVAADHSKQSVIVALRGTMGLSDMITDLNGQTDKLPIENCPEDWLCHRGMAKAAHNVKTALLNDHILDKAFNCRPDLNSQNYTLVLCGHSLGAGAAAILGILLRPHYTNLKAYLYAPPGGLLSMPAVEYTKQFATGIILGNDTVPRLGMAQLERLRYYVLLSLKSKQTSTRSIMTRTLCPSCCCGTTEVDYDPNQSLDTLYGLHRGEFEYNGMKIPFQTKRHILYVPGRLVHIVKNYSFESRTRRFFNGPIYQAVWTDNAAYDRLLISEGMFKDHLPNQLMDAMKMLFLKTLPAKQDSGARLTNVTTTSNNLSMSSSEYTTTNSCRPSNSSSKPDQANDNSSHFDTNVSHESTKSSGLVDENNNSDVIAGKNVKSPSPAFSSIDDSKRQASVDRATSTTNRFDAYKDDMPGDMQATKQNHDNNHDKVVELDENGNEKAAS